MANTTVKTQTYPCQSCDTLVTRPLARGQRPKWCDDCRKLSLQGAHCSDCDSPITRKSGGRCVSCSSELRRVNPKAVARTPEELCEFWRSKRSPLRAAIEDKNSAALLVAIRATAAVNTAGCWIWPRLSRDGYPTARFAKVTYPMHRLSLEAKHGAPLGSQAAHHMCAVTSCVNPDHLQPVTHRENTAEMLTRRAYLARIEELESALALLDPVHPVLVRIAVA